MRVVHIITGLRSGGAERLLVDRARLSRHQMAVVALATDGIIGDQLRARGVPVHCVGMTSNKDLRGLLRLAVLLRRMRPDTVHLHLYRSLVFGRVAARLAGVRRVVATEHSAQATRIEGRDVTIGIKGLYWLAEKLGTVTIAVSQETRDVLVQRWGIHPSRVTVVPNGVDVERLAGAGRHRETVRHRLGLREREVALVTVGRLFPGKNVDLVIDAARAFHETSGRDVCVLVVGTGPEEEMLREHATALPAGLRVEFLGEQADVLPYLGASDVYVSASQVETYGIAIVEGFVAGLPVVYTLSPAADDLRSLGGEDRVHVAESNAAALGAAVTDAVLRPVGASHVPARLLEAVDIRRSNDRVDAIEAGART